MEMEMEMENESVNSGAKQNANYAGNKLKGGFKLFDMGTSSQSILKNLPIQNPNVIIKCILTAIE